jgi:Ethanolamine utilization protein EutJ (predicted chaperonin)
LGAEKDTDKRGDLEIVRRKVEHAEAVFERLIQVATGLPSGVLSSDVQASSKLAELESMSRKNRIQERLAAHKANVKKIDD